MTVNYRRTFSILTIPLLFSGLIAPSAAAEGHEGETYIVATGRRLPYLYAIALDDALDPDNHGTANAVVSRAKVALDSLDGRPLGDPANLAISEDGRTLFITAGWLFRLAICRWAFSPKPHLESKSFARSSPTNTFGRCLPNG